MPEKERVMGYWVFDKERCKGCELCTVFCARECLTMSTEVNTKGYHFVENVRPEVCNGCALCAQMCPETALRIYRPMKIKHARATTGQR